MGNAEAKQREKLSKELSKQQSEKGPMMVGVSGVGKSTIVTQLHKIYNIQRSDLKRWYKTRIRESLLAQMQQMIDGYNDCKNSSGWYYDKLIEMGLEKEIGRLYQNDLSSKGMLSTETISACKCDHPWNEEIVAALRCLWNEDIIKNLYKNRHITKWHDNTEYYMNKLDVIATKQYMPNEVDILHFYRPCNVGREFTFKLSTQSKFKLYECDGQGNGKRKWEICFERANSVIFVVSLVGYNELNDFYYDDPQNSMTEQLKLFDGMLNAEALKGLPTILLLNKTDLFREKVRNIPITICPSFKHYKGNLTSYDESIEYIKEAFKSLNNDPIANKLYIYELYAMNTTNVEQVFANIIKIESQEDDNKLLPTSSSAPNGILAAKIRDSYSSKIMFDEMKCNDNNDEAVQKALAMFSKLINMGYDDKIAMQSASKFPDDINAAINHAIDILTFIQDADKKQSESEPKVAVIHSEEDQNNVADDKELIKGSEDMIQGMVMETDGRIMCQQDDLQNNSDADIYQSVVYDNESIKYGMVMDTPHGKYNNNIDNKHNDDEKKDAMFIVDDDRACQLEFARFLESSLGKNRCNKYLKKFIENESNDIRFVDPEMMDNDLLLNDIGMNKMDKKLFDKAMINYKNDCNKFETLFEELKMKEKHQQKFVNHGICTLWSFYHHINSAVDIQKIIKNERDSMIIWNVFNSNDNNNDQIEGN